MRSMPFGFGLDSRGKNRRARLRQGLLHLLRCNHLNPLIPQVFSRMLPMPAYQVRLGPVTYEGTHYE